MASLFPSGPWHFLFGGLAIGLAVSWLFLATGLIGGMSTFFSSTWSYVSSSPFLTQDRFVSSRSWRSVYAVGLVLGGVLFLLTLGGGHAFQTQGPGWRLLVGGLVSGFGARLSNGCTSGHGICGLASFQLPSLVAVLTFLGVAILTANVIGGAP